MNELPWILLSYAGSTEDNESCQIPLQILGENTPPEVFQKLVDAAPRTVGFQARSRTNLTGTGSTPLHTAVRLSHKEAMKILAGAYPKAHLLKNLAGNIPFDNAQNDKVRSLVVEQFFLYGLAVDLSSHSYHDLPVGTFRI